MYQITKYLNNLQKGLITLFISFVFSNCYSQALSVSDSLGDTVQKKIIIKFNAKPLASKALGVKLYDIAVVKSFYESVNFKPGWVNYKASMVNINTLCGYLMDAENDGLIIKDYHRGQIKRIIPLLQTWMTNKVLDSITELELLLTDACLCYARDVSTGQLYSKEMNVNRKQNLKAIPYNLKLKNALDSELLHVWFMQLPPDNCNYSQYRQALYNYKSIYLKGGFAKLEDSTIRLKPGDTGTLVANLFEYLMQTGDIMEPCHDGKYIFDSTIAKGIKHFQMRLGLHETQVVDKPTLRAMRIPVENRIMNIIASMERLRWLPQELGKKYIIVNIADYSLELIVDQKTQLTMDIIVGKPYKQTPVFYARMTYIVINPTWEMPQSIILEEILPNLKKNPAYLSKHHMKVYTQTGEEINASKIKWSKVNPKDFNYKIRQSPGPWNSLGRVKFMFPNEFNVYFHGTPNQRLFDEDVRDFSHGCMRVEDPVLLATTLLDDPQIWSQKTIEKQIAKEDEAIVVLKNYIPVHVTYLTGFVDNNHELCFRKDIYGKDLLFSQYMKEFRNRYKSMYDNFMLAYLDFINRVFLDKTQSYFPID